MEDEIVAVTESATADDLILAYDNMIFPWPVDEKVIPWFMPKKRGVLFFDDLHLSQSFKKFLKKHKYQISFCQDFEAVIKNCSQVKRKNQAGTWISAPIIKSYTELFNMEKAYSVEIWKGGELVGGLYGVIANKYVSGESMFHFETNTSKLALFSLIEKLKSFNLSYLDTQMVTPLLKNFGAKEITKKEFKELTDKSIINTDLYKKLKQGG